MAHHTTRRFASAGLLAAATIAAGVTIASTSAQADWRYRRGHDGGAVAAGLIGGLAVGALAAGAIASSRPAYGYDAYPPPPRRYAPAPVYYAQPRGYYVEPQPYCEIRRQKVWLDSWTYEVRRVRVCN